MNTPSIECHKMVALTLYIPRTFVPKCEERLLGKDPDFGGVTFGPSKKPLMDLSRYNHTGQNHNPATPDQIHIITLACQRFVEKDFEKEYVVKFLDTIVQAYFCSLCNGEALGDTVSKCITAERATNNHPKCEYYTPVAKAISHCHRLVSEFQKHPGCKPTDSKDQSFAAFFNGLSAECPVKGLLMNGTCSEKEQTALSNQQARSSMATSRSSIKLFSVKVLLMISSVFSSLALSPK